MAAMMTQTKQGLGSDGWSDGPPTRPRPARAATFSSALVQPRSGPLRRRSTRSRAAFRSLTPRFALGCLAVQGCRSLPRASMPKRLSSMRPARTERARANLLVACLRAQALTLSRGASRRLLQLRRSRAARSVAAAVKSRLVRRRRCCVVGRCAVQMVCDHSATRWSLFSFAFSLVYVLLSLS